MGDIGVRRRFNRPTRALVTTRRSLDMALTSKERDFLDSFVYEATNGPPFGGPATRALKQLGICYSELSWILSAYQRELCLEGKIPSGILNPNPPESPWLNLEEVRRRSTLLKDELESQPAAGKQLLPQLAENPEDTFRN
jgi:hypothetical protein